MKSVILHGLPLTRISLSLSNVATANSAMEPFADQRFHHEKEDATFCKETHPEGRLSPDAQGTDRQF
jgi:hypothetical protein